jgi:ubiquinone/menaquinone biosynthesis C-methylase UbiE
VVGLDASLRMLEIARRLTAGEGLEDRVTYCQGSSYAQPFPDGSFDAALVVTTLGHLDAPDQAVLELVRVTKPGGTVLAVEWDQGTVVLDHPDEPLTATLIDHYYRNYVADRWAGRKLLDRFVAAGLREPRLSSFVASDHAGGYLGIIKFWVAAGVQDELITQEQGNRWLAELEHKLAAGTFVYALTYFACYGTKATKDERQMTTNWNGANRQGRQDERYR